MNGELLANCEECGKAIPVENALCSDCRGNDFDTCDEAASRIRLSPEQEEHVHGDLRLVDLRLCIFECSDCGAQLCLPELAESFLLSVASE